MPMLSNHEGCVSGFQSMMLLNLFCAWNWPRSWLKTEWMKEWRREKHEPWSIYQLQGERGIAVGKEPTSVLLNQLLSPGNHSELFRNDPDWLYLLLQCLVTCGKGHKHRQVWCQFGEDRLNDRICDPETKPTSMQTCQQPECASWQAGPWGQVFWMITFLTTFFPSYLE